MVEVKDVWVVCIRDDVPRGDANRFVARLAMDMGLVIWVVKEEGSTVDLCLIRQGSNLVVIRLSPSGPGKSKVFSSPTPFPELEEIIGG